MGKTRKYVEAREIEREMQESRSGTDMQIHITARHTQRSISELCIPCTHITMAELMKWSRF